MTDPETRRGATGHGTSGSQVRKSTTEPKAEPLDLQAQKLSRLFSFCTASAYTIAGPAYGAAR
jgi:hypothetical protein